MGLDKLPGLKGVELPRDLLASTLEDAGGKLLHIAAKRVPDALSGAVLDVGTRALRDTASRIRETPTTQWVSTARQQLHDRPGLTFVGLMGMGVLAGRLLRLKGPIAMVGAGLTGAGRTGRVESRRGSTGGDARAGRHRGQRLEGRGEGLVASDRPRQGEEAGRNRTERRHTRRVGDADAGDGRVARPRWLRRERRQKRWRRSRGPLNRCWRAQQRRGSARSRRQSACARRRALEPQREGAVSLRRSLRPNGRRLPRRAPAPGRKYPSRKVATLVWEPIQSACRRKSQARVGPRTASSS